MSGPTPRFLCIGGATVDRKFRLSEPARAGTSNPARSSASFGGVARNVAETLARLGNAVSLVSAVGDDADGRALLAHLAGVGVDLAGVRVAPGRATAQYAAVLNPDGTLEMAVADMGVLDEAYAGLALSLEGAPKGGWLFADCNAPADGLAAVIAMARRRGSPLAVDAISAPKARRLPADLSGVGCLFLNRDEAESALASANGASPETLAAALAARGAARVVLTLGAEGACLAEGGRTIRVAAEPAEVVDVTGAGDAMIAGALHGLARGLPLIDAARLGARLAARTVAGAHSVDMELTPALGAELLARLSGKAFDHA